MSTMDHDSTHCLDRCDDCPKDCYRAKLDDDFRKNYFEFMHVPLSWAHLKGSSECPKNKC